jgi:hypothetical protein
MLIAPPGGLHCAVTHSKSIGWYSWKPLHSLRCIQDANRFPIQTVKDWNMWNISSGLHGTLGAVQTPAQVYWRHREQLRSLSKLCGRIGAIFSQQWFLRFPNHKSFHLSYYYL